MFRLAFPFWSWMPRTPKLRRDLATIRTFVADVIAERRAEQAAAGDLRAREDVLSRFMSLGHSTDTQLYDAAVNFILAGRDTTAQLLTWSFYLLASHPAVQAKLLDHIETLIGDRELSLDSLKHMDYLQAVMDETLRLYPPVPIDFKKSINADRLPSGTDVPPDTYIMVLASRY
jgi:cytochrome P450